MSFVESLQKAARSGAEPAEWSTKDALAETKEKGEIKTSLGKKKKKRYADDNLTSTLAARMEAITSSLTASLKYPVFLHIFVVEPRHSSTACG